jgi:hypothetical protein
MRRRPAIIQLCDDIGTNSGSEIIEKAFDADTFLHRDRAATADACQLIEPRVTDPRR